MTYRALFLKAVGLELLSVVSLVPSAWAQTAITPAQSGRSSGLPSPVGAPVTTLSDLSVAFGTKTDVLGGTVINKPPSGIVLQPQTNQLGYVVDPRDYGAFCDGTPHPLSGITSIRTTAGLLNTTGWTIAQWRTAGWPHATDVAQLMDGAAMQEAEYALSPYVGGRLKVPAGCYVNRTIHIVNAISSVSGDPGVGGSVYTYGDPATSGGPHTHNFNVFSNEAPLVTYSNFAFNPGGGFGSGAGSPYAVQSAIAGTEVFAIYDPFAAGNSQSANYFMTVQNVTGTLLYSGILSGGGGDLIDRINISQQTQIPTSSGVKFDSTYTDTRQVWHSSIYGFGYGIALFGQGSTIDLIADELLANGQCMAMVPPAGGHIVSIVIDHIWCDNSTNGGADFDASASGSFISRVRAINSWFSSSHAGNGMFFTGAQIWGVSIGGGTEFYANAGDAIHVDTSLGNTKGFSVNGIKCAGNTGACLDIGAGVSGWSLLNSDLTPNADFGPNGYPLFVAAGASDYYRVLGNDMHGNTNAVTNPATGTHIAVANNLQ